jgi:8-oxo-dGTP diphosphatase
MDIDKLQICQVGVKSIIVNHENKALVMIKSINGKLFWDVPGGRMEKGESIEQAINRELKEEILNLKEFKVKDILNVDIVHRLDTSENIDLFIVFYRVEADLEKIELSEEHQSYKWISLEEIEFLEEEAQIRDKIKEGLRLSLKK